jgi:pimeloyl-ACP methyl ester carboxylesterase
MKALLIVIVLLAMIPLVRRFLANKIWAAPPGEEFAGSMFTLGANLVCCPDRSHLPADVVDQATLICFPGFLEDMRFFLEVHRDTPARLIIVNNANYQNPFDCDATASPDWYTQNPYPVGTIAHDAYCVNQVLEHMTGQERVVLHGHSRGGAVVLETGIQKPEHAKGIEAILEAAVVPQGKLVDDGEKKLQPLGLYLFPFVFSLMRILPESLRLKSPMMWVTNATKDKIVAAIPFTPRQYATTVVNSANIIDWQARTEYESYDNFKQVTLYVGQRDSVLSRSAMMDSAAKSTSVSIVETTGTDHFISLEDPARIRNYFTDL